MKPIKLKDILHLFVEGAEIFINDESKFFIQTKRNENKKYIAHIEDEYKQYLEYEVVYIIDGYDEYDLTHIELKEVIDNVKR